MLGESFFVLLLIIFFVVVYVVMNLGVFVVIVVVGCMLNDFNGLGCVKLLVGVVMVFFLFLLVGILLFVGFVGKFLFFVVVIYV